VNKARRKAIEDLRAKLEAIKEELELVQEQEQEAFDNLPESLQGAERGQHMETCIDQLGYAADSIGDAIDNLDMEE
jgi:hypothetical protein